MATALRAALFPGSNHSDPSVDGSVHVPETWACGVKDVAVRQPTDAIALPGLLSTPFRSRDHVGTWIRDSRGKGGYTGVRTFNALIP